MSAFVVSRAHIDALVSLAIEGPEGRGPAYPGDATSRGLSWYLRDPEEISAEAGGGEEGWAAIARARREARLETADGIGRMLAVENAASVLFRYPEHDNSRHVPAWTTDESYTHTRWATRPTAVEGLSIIACFEYQAASTRAGGRARRMPSARRSG
jgi:hypothetical protein